MQPAAPITQADSLAQELASEPDSVAGGPGAAVRALEDSLDRLRALEQTLRDSLAVEAGGTGGGVGGLWTEIRLWVQETTGLSLSVFDDLVQSLLWVVVVLVLRWVALAVVQRQTEDPRARYTWRKGLSYLAGLLIVLTLLWIWIDEFGSVATFLGLLTAGLAIALKDPVTNIVAWAFLMARRPFVPGDRIMIGGHKGDVIDVRIFQFTLLEVGTKTGAGQSTGRLVHVPNGFVFSHGLVNATRGFPYVWNELAVLVTFESDWKAAKALLCDLAEEHAEALSEEAERRVRRAAQESMIFYSKLTPTVYTTVRDSGVELTVRFLCEPRRQRGAEEAIWEGLLDALAERSDIDLAYPTLRYYTLGEEHRGGAPSAETPSGS